MIGRNLSINDSFTLKLANDSPTPFTAQLFNLGGGASTQTSFTTGTISTPINSSQSIPFFVNGVVIDPIGMEIYLTTLPLATPITTHFFPTGTTIDQINAYFQNIVLNPTTSQTGSFYMQQKPNTTDQYDMIIDFDYLPLVISFVDYSFVPVAVNFPLQATTLTFANGNPFVTLSGTADINFIQNSEVGNSYRIMGVDVITNNQDQLLQDINYGNRDADGKIWSASFTPTIDPYQQNAISLHAIGSSNPIGAEMDNFTITPETTFSYTILGNTYSRLTFNYVRATEANMNLFNQAVASELLMKFAAEKKYLDSLKYRKGVFLQ